MKRMTLVSVVLGLVTLYFAGQILAQEPAGVKVGKGDLKIGGILQAGYTYNLEDTLGTDAFTMNRARFLFWGTIIPDKVKYFVQSELKFTANTVSLLDYKAQFFFIRKTEVTAGRFIPNFTLYMPYATSKLEMINYPQTTTQYATWRQMGIQAATTTKYLDFNLGIFNGADIPDNITDNNDAKDFLFRVEIKPPVDQVALRFGSYAWMGNALPPASYTYKDTMVHTISVPNPDDKSFQKNRFGGFATSDYSRDKWTLRFRGEFIMGRDEYLTAPDVNQTDTRSSQAYFVHLGIQPLKQLEFLMRYETYDPNTDVEKDGISALTGGVNYYLDGINSMFYLNYIHKMEQLQEIDNDVVQAQVQISF
jgi:hypothetical protein